MKPELHILHLEDDRNDAELIHSLLGEQGIVCDVECVATRDDFLAALEQREFDLIFSDFALPGFDGHAALALAREKCPEVPFLFVSGTLGEEVAIDTLKCGATDYVLKQRLSRLAPAVRRAIAETRERTSRKRAEESLMLSEFKYRHLFECLGEAAFVVDTGTGRVLDANKQAEALLGRARGEIIGLKQNQFHSPATIEEYHRQFAGLGHPPARVLLEGEVLATPGRAIPVAISAAPITFHGRRLMLGLYRDITERKQAEQEIQKLSAELERLLRARTGELDATHRELEIYFRFIARDLRTRLRAIGDSAHEAMVPGTARSGETTGSTLAPIQSGIEQAEQSMARLLAFSSLREKPRKHSTLDMTALAQAVFDELKLRSPERELRFELEALPPASGDADEIRQLFAELLSNAIKFTHGRTPADIQVSYVAGQTQNTFCVSDNGVGFPPEDADRLFSGFHRVRHAGEFESAGLGLAIIQRIVQRHNGQVGVEGSVNGGATFYFTLPKTDHTQAPARPGRSTDT